MKRYGKRALGVGFFLAGVAFAVVAFKTRPEAEKKSEPLPLPVVKVSPVQFGDEELRLPSQGLIEPRMRAQLSAEVGGKVVFVSPKFDAGGEFDKDEVMIRIDATDYEAALAQAEASVADAQVALDAEQVKSDQARRDWKRQGNKGEPTPLFLREPYLKSARAKVKAAESAVEKARRDLERTSVKAPFAGRLASVHTEVGSYLPPSSPIADIYTTAPYEIRLPLSLDDWSFLKSGKEGEPVGEVTFSAKVGGEEHRWTGRLMRTEGEIERESRSIYVVAQVSPAESGGLGALMQPGLFVKAGIEGQVLKNVAKVPFRAFVDLDRVMLVDPDDIIRFRSVEVVRREGESVLVKQGLEEGDRLCLTELADTIDGVTRVKPQMVAPEAPAPPGGEPLKP